MYKKNMEKDNQNIYTLNIYMSHFRDKKKYMQALNTNTYEPML